MIRAARLVGILIVGYLLSSCSSTERVLVEKTQAANLAVAASPSPASDSSTQVTQTTLAATADADRSSNPTITPTARSTRKAPTYTPAISPSETIHPSNPTQAAPCFRAAFIQDVTYSDGARVAPGEIFLKIWRFRNDGACIWDQSFVLDFVGGQRFSGPDEVGTRYFEAGAGLEFELGDRNWNDLQIFRVQPGDIVDIPVLLRAPLEEGRQRGYWRVLADDGENVVMQFYVDVEVDSTLESETGQWSGEWAHENLWSDPSGNPLVILQQDRQIEGYFYSSDGEVFLIDASLSSDEMRMNGSFGQVWQSGWPFVLEMYPNQNVFHGYYNDSDFTGGAWCGSRSGYTVPLGECLLVD